MLPARIPAISDRCMDDIRQEAGAPAAHVDGRHRRGTGGRVRAPSSGAIRAGPKAWNTRTFAAARNCGATCNGDAITVSRNAQLEDALLVTGFGCAAVHPATLDRSCAGSLVGLCS